MWYWKKYKGSSIFWYNHDNFKLNENFIKKQSHWLYNTFNSECFTTLGYELYWRKGYIITDDISVERYLNNFVNSLPEKATLYFENSSFPRTKLQLTPYKRTIKREKADFFVLEESAKIIDKDVEFVIFTDTVDIFAIQQEYLLSDFKGKLQNIYESNCTNIKFKGNLQLLYKGFLRFVIDEANSLKLFSEGLYTKPFILDNDLDKLVNQYLPDPDLNAIKTIYDMINSPDSATVKLGSTMATGFNISKWPLTFICLFCTSQEWNRSYNGSNLTLVKQLKNTLNIKGGYGLQSVASIIDSSDEKYSKEDIALAQDFVRTLPNLERFCKNKESFYLEGLPFIPDEYKH